MFLVGSEFQGTSNPTRLFFAASRPAPARSRMKSRSNSAMPAKTVINDHLSRVDYGQTIQFSDHHRISRPELIHHAQGTPDGHDSRRKPFPGKISRSPLFHLTSSPHTHLRKIQHAFFGANSLPALWPRNYIPGIRVRLYAERGRKSVGKVESAHVRSFAERGCTSEVLSAAALFPIFGDHAGSHR
jgi:hypothetical protein